MSIYTPFWQPHFPGWLKADSDGLSKGNPGAAACEALFRDD